MLKIGDLVYFSYCNGLVKYLGRITHLRKSGQIDVKINMRIDVGYKYHSVQRHKFIGFIKENDVLSINKEVMDEVIYCGGNVNDVQSQ